MVDKSAFIKIIKEQFPGISDEGVKAIMVNVSVETGVGTRFTEYAYPMEGDNGIFTKKNGKYIHEIQSARKYMVDMGYANGTLVNKTGVFIKDEKNWNAAKGHDVSNFRQTAQQKKDYAALSSDQKKGLFYNGDIDTVGGGYGPLQLTVGTGTAIPSGRNEAVQAYMDAQGIEGSMKDFMLKLASDPEYGLKHTLGFYKTDDAGVWNTKSLNKTNSVLLSKKINPGRDSTKTSFVEHLDIGDAWATDSITKYNALDFTEEGNEIYKVTEFKEPQDLSPEITTVTETEEPDLTGELTQKEKDQIEIDIRPTPISPQVGPDLSLTNEDFQEWKLQKNKKEKVEEQEAEDKNIQLNNLGTTDDPPEQTKEEIEILNKRNEEVERIAFEEDERLRIEYEKEQQQLNAPKKKTKVKETKSEDVEESTEGVGSSEPFQRDGKMYQVVDGVEKEYNVGDPYGNGTVEKGQEGEVVIIEQGDTINVKKEGEVNGNDEDDVDEVEVKEVEVKEVEVDEVKVDEVEADEVEVKEVVDEVKEVDVVAQIPVSTITPTGTRSVSRPTSSGNLNVLGGEYMETPMAIPSSIEVGAEGDGDTPTAIEKKEEANKYFEEQKRLKEEEEEKTRIANAKEARTGGVDYKDNKEYLAEVNNKRNNATIRLLAADNPTVDFTGVINRQDYTNLALKSKEQGGLGMLNVDAVNAEWEARRSQFISAKSEPGEAKRREQIDLANKVYDNILLDTDGFSGVIARTFKTESLATLHDGSVGFTSPSENKGIRENYDTSDLSEEEQAAFKVAVLNQIPKDQWVKVANEDHLTTAEKDVILTNARSQAFVKTQEVLNARGRRLEATGNEFNFNTSVFQQDVDALVARRESKQEQITGLKQRYGSFVVNEGGGLEYKQYKDMSSSDQQAVARINSEMKSLEDDRKNLEYRYGGLTVDRDNYNNGIAKYGDDLEANFSKWAYNETTKTFDASFKSTKDNNIFNEYLKDNVGWGADVVSTFANEMIRYKALRAIINPYTLAATAIATTGTLIMDATADQWENKVYQYSPHDINEYNAGYTHTGMLFDQLASLASINYLPVSNNTSGNVIDPLHKKEKGDGFFGDLYEKIAPGWAGGQGNYTAYSTSKTFAELLPYTLNIMGAGVGVSSKSAAVNRAIRMKNTYRPPTSSGGKLINSLRKDWMTSEKGMRNINMIRINHKLTLFDNYADGRARGLDAGNAFSYANWSSLVTGISQTIMPDYNWLKTSGGKRVGAQLLKELTSSQTASGVSTTILAASKRMATKAAFKTAGKNFLKEHLEEQIDVAFNDIVKYAYIAGHSADIAKAEVQAEILSGTSILTLPLGSISAVRTRRNIQANIYKEIRYQGAEIIANGYQELAAIDDKIKNLSNTSKDKKLKAILQNESALLKNNIKEAQNITEAMRVGPKNVTDAQVDLLVKKNKLIDEKRKLNKKDKASNLAEHERIDNEIEKLDVEIEKNSMGNYQTKLYDTLLKNAIKFSESKLGKSMGLTIRHFPLDRENYEIAVEEERQSRRERNALRTKEIKKLHKLRKGGKDVKKNSEEIKRLKAEIKRDNENVDYDGPGFIKWRKSEDGKSFEPEMMINEAAAKKDGNYGVVVHEMLHVMLMRTIEKNPKSMKALSFLLRKEMLDNPAKYGDTFGYVTQENDEGGKFDKYKFEKDINNMAFDEMFTVFIEALAQGNISIEKNLITNMEDFFRRLARKVGVNFKVKGHQGMVNFLKDFNKEMQEGGGTLSLGMQKIMVNGLDVKTTKTAQRKSDEWEAKMIERYKIDAWQPALIKTSKSISARKGDIYNSKKIKQDLELSENTKQIVEENTKIRNLILDEGLEDNGKIIASEALQARLIENNMATAISLGNFAARNPKIMGLETGKRVSANQFISGYYEQLTDLARTYDASINEFGQYMNTILPLRYGQILEAEKAGSVEGDSVGLDYIADVGEDTDMITTPEDVDTGPTINTAERLGVSKETKPFVDQGLSQIKELQNLQVLISEEYSEKTAEQIAEITARLESSNMADLEIENLTVKKAPNLLYKTVGKIFGIDEDKLNPRSDKWLANLRKDNKRGSNEVRSAQRAVVKHVSIILASVFNEGHTMAHKSSGMPKSLLKFGYNKSSKRIGNNFPQYKKTNLSANKLLEFVGIKKVKKNGVTGYEFTVDRNTGTKLLAIAQMTDRNMSLQAINKGLEETGDLEVKIKNSIEDGLSKSSRSITYIRSQYQQTIREKMPDIGQRLNALDREWDIDDVKRVFKDVFAGTPVKYLALAKDMFGATGIIMRYRTAKSNHEAIGKEFMSFKEFTVEQLQVLEKENFTNSVIKLMGITLINGNKPTNGEFFTLEGIKTGRTQVGLLMSHLSDMVSDSENEMTKQDALDIIWLIEQQHKTAAQAGNGKYWFKDGTNEFELAYYAKDKKYMSGEMKGKKHHLAGKPVGNNGKNRMQLFASKDGSTVDFRKFTNKYLSQELQLPEKGTYSEIKLQDQNKIGATTSMTDEAQSKKSKYSKELREIESKLAEKVVILQVKYFGEKLNDKDNEFDEVDFARHMLVFGSSMSTASRRAAMLIGIQDGIIVDGKFDKSIKIILEHGKPHSFLIAELIKIVKNVPSSKWDKAMKVPFIDYKANIITEKFDNTLTKGSRKSIMDPNPENYTPGLVNGWTQRTFNIENRGNKDVTAIRLIEDVIAKNFKGQVFGESHAKAAGLNIKTSEEIELDKTINKGLKSSRSIEYSKNTKGITVLDFDDTLATSKSLIRFTRPDKTKGTLNAEQYANTYQELTDLGYKWDFSEFNKVVDGKTAPLFNKAMKLQSKFGPENMFVLTARPAEAAPAIFAFLQANGLKIPLNNITGLANSTANAKALWMAEKVGEGYNDFYFADDALQNVQAVDNILEQFDVKRKVQLARSKSINYSKDFNEIIDNTTGVDAEKRFSAAKAKKRGQDKGRFAIFIPPSAEDFVGLLYSFVGKGKKGEEHMRWLKEKLITPLNKAYRDLDSAKQAISNDYKNLSDQFPRVRKLLFKKIDGLDFTYNDAIRVYLWNKFNFKVWGLAASDQKKLVEIVEGDSDLVAFAEILSKISKNKDGYVAPTEEWMVEDVRTDLMEATERVSRKVFFAEFIENAAIIFSKENLNKIEAIYGTDFRSALEDMLYRIENGTNRTFGNNKLVNRFMNWINGSVGTTMFFNSRSAVLQSLSLVNFINWTDNNLLAAAKAFANPKQFWSDFSMIFNSDMLKQRRAGRSFDVNSQELTSQVANSAKPVRAALNYLLQLGFLPTQIMDSFAIASGGSAFYRNRVNTYLVDGLNLAEAEEKAFADFQEIAEATQQSARQDMVSQQQASVLGRIILAFQNTPMQYARLMKKAILDLVAGRGDAKSHVSRIIYYGAIQNIIFYSLQTALFAAMFGEDDDDDEEVMNKKTERVINGTIDSVLRGMGVGGAVISTLKNMARAFADQQGKPRNQRNESAVLIELLNISPPIGIKARQLSSAQRTLNWNQDKIKEIPYYNIDNPIWESAGLTTQALTNVPLARMHSKINNVRESMNKENEGWQRLAIFMGWTKWNLGMGDKKRKKQPKPKFDRGGFNRTKFKRSTFSR